MKNEKRKLPTAAAPCNLFAARRHGDDIWQQALQRACLAGSMEKDKMTEKRSYVGIKNKWSPFMRFCLATEFKLSLNIFYGYQASHRDSS